jgi:hypothetical protein
MATTENSTGYRTFQATNSALATSVRVKVDSNGLISAASATDPWIGVTVCDIAASDYGTIKLRNASGTMLVTASAAISRGSRLYPTANGKVDDAAGTGVFTGLVALEAATADGDIIEAAPSDVLTFTADANQAACPAGGTGATAGAWDTSQHRDAAIALINAMRDALINAGIMKGSA